MSTNPLIRLGELGQSPWLDFITRDLVASGELARLIDEDGLQGMTSNPTIFEKAITSSADYDDDIRRLTADGRDPAQVFEALAIHDVQAACDAFLPLYRTTDGRHGFVSLEVSPTLAHDSEGTIAEARRLWKELDRPNAMIKIPGTKAGLPAITRALTDGINVNVTLLFSVDRYREVIEAFLGGLEARLAVGDPIGRLASVASFFVSRVDGKVDARLDQQGDPHGLRGKIAIANAAMAYATFESLLRTDRWTVLADAGARPQRPLWASTSTKDPKYPDVYYVEALIAADTVNTMPPDTLDAYRDHGDPIHRIQFEIDGAPARLEALSGQGIDLGEVTRLLEDEGVKKFAQSYTSLLSGIETKIGAVAGRQ
jgi:transaldolase